jgi:fatty acid desaturase
MFKNPADRLPAALVLTANVASFAVYFLVDSPWWLLGFWALMLGPRGAMGAWSHHHQHCFTFRSTALNRVLELGYALQTGITTHLWVLHHVLGHHLNYLDQTKDESRWARRSGVKMGMIEYILNVTFTAYFRAYQVGRKHPRYLPAYVGAISVTVALVTALVWYRPIPGLLVFVLPMVTSLMWVVWATYDHHAGLPTDDPWQASYNIENSLYNLVSCNLGYHTAHHHRPGVHWADLPQLHAKIRHRIPPHLLVRSTFDVFLPKPETERDAEISASRAAAEPEQAQ